MISTCDCREKAFTLLEILVVIAVIGLLIAIAIPALQKAVGISRQTVCMNNLRQLSMSIHTYSAMNDGYLPPSARNNNLQMRYPGNTDPALGGPPWYERLKESGLIAYEPEHAGILHCPSDRRSVPFVSYGANRHMMGFSDPRNETEKRNWPLRKMSSLKGNTANLILLGERGPLEDADWTKVEGPWSMSGTSVSHFGGYMSKSEAGFYLGRHGDARLTKKGSGTYISNARVPFVMVDGHVESFSGEIKCDILREDIQMHGFDLDRAFIADSPGRSWPKLTDKDIPNKWTH